MSEKCSIGLLNSLVAPPIGDTPYLEDNEALLAVAGPLFILITYYHELRMADVLRGEGQDDIENWQLLFGS